MSIERCMMIRMMVEIPGWLFGFVRTSFIFFLEKGNSTTMSMKMLKFMLRRRADSSHRVDGVRKQSSDSPFVILLTNFYWHCEWKSLGFKANWRPAVKVSKKGKKEKTLFLQQRGRFFFKALGCERQVVYRSDHHPPQPSPPKKCPKKRQAGVKSPPV